MRRAVIGVVALFVLAMPLYAGSADQPAQSIHGGAEGGGHQTTMCPVMEQMHGQGFHDGQQMPGEWMGRSNPWFQYGISLILQNYQKLGLDDQQKAKLNDMRRKYSKDIVRQEAELKMAEIDLDALLKEPEINLQKAREALSKIEGIQTQIRYLRIEAFTEARKVLTNEQKSNLMKMIEEPAPMTGGMMCPRMGEGMTGGMPGQHAPAPQKEGEVAPATGPHGH